ncbi:MAG: hypothetical protein GQ529_13605 [Methyloprofundus sp.]|nr:hypothetical protein [Methyloprofundus sp.]
MGKASRNKKLKKQENEALKRYGNLKLSEALLTLCEPYKIPDMIKEQYDKIISFSAIAWNIASFPEELCQQKFLEMVNLIPELKGIQEDELISLMENGKQDDPSDAVVMLQILSGMIQLKFKLYPNDDRIVMDYWFESKSGGDMLQVKSVIPNASGE